MLTFDRAKRSTDYDETAVKYDWLKSNKSKNGTNIIILHLNETLAEMSDQDASIKLYTILIPVILVIVIAVVCCVFIVMRKRRRKRGHKYSHPPKRNNLELAQQNSNIYKVQPLNKRVSVRCSSNLDLKESVVYRGEHGKSAVRVKNTNIQKDKNISKNGTEV